MRFMTLVFGLGLAGLLCLADARTATAQEKGAVVELDGLKSKAPATWKEEEPPERLRAMRLKQFRVAKEEGDPADAEIVINFFGKGGGGGLEANLGRWKGMMKPAAGKSADDAFKVEKLNVGDVDVTLLDAEGTYLGAPFEKAQPKAEYRMLRAYFDSKNGPYFISLTGPAKTVGKQKAAFVDWLKNFK